MTMNRHKGIFMLVLALLSLPAARAEKNRMQPPAAGLERITGLMELPLLDHGVKAGYEGSIDKKGVNADWDCWLYPYGRGEWVMFDVHVRDCSYNFVHLLYISSSYPVFQFYFGGDDEPRMQIRVAEFRV